MYILSSNYRRSRNSTGEPRWLFRHHEQDASQAIAVAWVDATDVEFKQSNEVEAGFGCAIVAYCKNATYHFPTTPAGVHLQELFFDDIESVFRRKFDGKIIHKCARLILEPSGQIFAVLYEEPKNAPGLLPGAIETAFSGEM